MNNEKIITNRKYPEIFLIEKEFEEHGFVQDEKKILDEIQKLTEGENGKEISQLLTIAALSRMYTDKEDTI
ncbi:hypothetical protein HX744_03875, partial [Pseudonocardia sp. ICBG1122]|nr:hypothetical protein [Pseudonocardia pini]